MILNCKPNISSIGILQLYKSILVYKLGRGVTIREIKVHVFLISRHNFKNIVNKTIKQFYND